jgi:hypothetical protein
MLLFSPKWLFLYPGVALMLGGLAIGGTLIARPLEVQGVRLSSGTLIYAVMIIEVGFQALLFAVMSRAYAVQEGLVPPSARLRLIERVLSLESGIIVGLGLMAVGALLLAYALGTWSHAGFGDLNAEQIVRIVISSSLAISMGFQVMFSSFLLSTLKLSVRRLQAL